MPDGFIKPQLSYAKRGKLGNFLETPPTVAIPSAPAMTDALCPAVARFLYILEQLCPAIGDRLLGPVLAPAITIGIQKRLRRIIARFAVLAAQIQAGILPEPKRRLRRSSSVIPSVSAPDASRPTKQSDAAAANHSPRLPNRRGWLVHMRPGLHRFGGLVRCLLNAPQFVEFHALLAASPEIRKLVRSVCHMFGVPLIPALREPPRERVRRPKPENQPHLANEESSSATTFLTGLDPGLSLLNLPRLQLPPGYDPLVRVPRRKKPA